jgi:tetratricopeptide (TPR) repeat protein
LALDSFSHALKLDPTDKLSYYLRGLVYYSEAKYTEAREDWARAGYLDMKLRAINDQAHGLYLAGNEKSAEASLLLAVKLAPISPDTYYALGGLLWGLPGREADAIAAFRVGIAYDPTSSFDRYWAEGRLHFLEKRWLSAAVALEKAVSQSPQNRDSDYRFALTQLGIAYWQSGQTERATVRFKSLIQQWPDNFDPYLYLSMMAGEHGKSQESIIYMLDYLRIKPDDFEACEIIVKFISSHGDRQLAEWALQEMVTFGSADTRCFSKLSILYP